MQSIYLYPKLHFVGLPASSASDENAQGFSTFVLFLMPEAFPLHVSFWSRVAVVSLLFVAHVWVCDKVISTTPATRQQTPNTVTKPAKMKTLECRRRFTCSDESLLGESRSIWSGEIEFNSWSPIPRFYRCVGRFIRKRTKNLILADYKDQAIKEVVTCGDVISTDRSSKILKIQ